MSIDTGLPGLKFPVAAERWLEWKTPYYKQKTVDSYNAYVKGLKVFFYDLRLEEITAGHLREYQVARQINRDGFWSRTGGPSCVNHEINTLSQILEHAGLWEKLKKYYKPLPARSWTPPRSMTQEEEDRFFIMAAANPDYEVAYLATSITNNTSASGCEVRMLQLQHVSLEGSFPYVHIPSDRVKNEFRGRRIPLNETAHKQFERALMRAYKLGATRPDHYLFPFREKRNKYDATKPASSSWMRKQFEDLREAAGLPWLRPHDLRHQAITRMLETGAPETSVMAVAGHVSKQMLNHYSHARMEAKMEVMRAIEPKRFISKRLA